MSEEHDIIEGKVVPTDEDAAAAEPADAVPAAAPAYDDDEDDGTIYAVVLNHEEQYSIWAVDRPVPDGWREEGTRGTKKECLDHIDKVWTDMRPLSVRKYMEELERRLAEEPPPEPEEEPEGPTLVERLAEGSHPVEITVRPERDLVALRESVERGYVFIKFTDTQGGTELGVELDTELSDVSEADYEAQTGRLHIVGELNLDFVPVRCVADVDLATFLGEGHLEILDPAAVSA